MEPAELTTFQLKISERKKLFSRCKVEKAALSAQDLQNRGPFSGCQLEIAVLNSRISAAWGHSTPILSIYATAQHLINACKKRPGPPSAAHCALLIQSDDFPRAVITGVPARAQTSSSDGNRIRTKFKIIFARPIRSFINRDMNILTCKNFQNHHTL